MKARSTLFAALSIRPHTVSELAKKLPFSKHTIYKALGSLSDDKLIRKRRERGSTVVQVSEDYAAQKLREVYIKSLSRGIDPGRLTMRSTISVWKELAEPRSLEDIRRNTGLSLPSVRKIVGFLVDSGLAICEKRKPMIVVRNEKHRLNGLLGQLAWEERTSEKVYYQGRVPFERLLRTPDEIERLLFEGIDSSLAIEGTGFHVRGEGKLRVLESVDEEPGPEELFLRDIGTPEGVEDFCLLLMGSGRLDNDRLLELARERKLVNTVGCYLDILRGLGVDLEIGEGFGRSASEPRAVFLREERKYGKGGWEGRYEGRWNLDLYLDLGAIEHGVRSHGLPRTAGSSQE